MRRRPAARAAPARFTLDRERFERFSRQEFGELLGVESGWEGGVARALEYRFHDAREAGAILCPPGLEVIVYGLDNSVIVAVREEEPVSHLPVALRQLATYSFEIKYVLNLGDESFEEACAAIEELLARANELLPSFEALRRGERGLRHDGRRRRLGRLRR